MIPAPLLSVTNIKHMKQLRISIVIAKKVNKDYFANVKFNYFN